MNVMGGYLNYMYVLVSGTEMCSTEMCSKPFFMEIQMLLQSKNSVGTDRENVVPGSLIMI